MGELLGSVPFLHRRAIPLVVFLALIWAGLGEVRPAKAFDATLVAAGDIAGCGHVGDTLTAALVAATGGTVATLGDSVYNNGTAAQFANCYGPTWGRFKWRTRPTPGNHEYRTPGANGYFHYFGDRAGPRGKGWYSYNIGSWHVVVLNSNCSRVACGKGSEQERWLRADLAAHSQQCTLAYWHHPRFSSDNRHANSAAVGPFWDALYEHGAELVLSGHAHTYERFAPQTPWAKADPAYGIRQFVVGTGGAGRYGFRGVKANSQVRNASTFGVLKLDLRSGGYDWQFVPQAGKTFSDSGSASCHGRPTVLKPPPTTTTSRPVVASSSTTTTRPKTTSSSTTTTRPVVTSSSTTTTRPKTTSSSTTTTRPRVTTTTKRPATTTTTRRAGYYG